MKKYKIFIYVGIFVLGGIIMLFCFLQDPPSKTLGNFLSHYKDPSSVSLSYIHRKSHQDPFVDVFLGGSLIKGYKIKKTQKYEGTKAKITVSLYTNCGAISLDFILENMDDKWYIVKFPKTTIIDGAIPLWTDDKGEFSIDIAGTQLSCNLNSSDKVIEMDTPISITLMDNYIADYTKLQPIILDKVISASNEYIEDRIIGKIPIAKPIAIYDVVRGYPEYIERELPAIGSTHLTIFKSCKAPYEGIIALIDSSNRSHDSIRVALNNSDFSSLYHEDITLSSTHGMHIRNFADDFNYTIDKNQEVILTFHENQKISITTNGQLLDGSSNRWYIAPENESLIIVNNIVRSHSQNAAGTPYRGNLEVSAHPEGLVLINEVGLEEYLYTVVPSEMPIKFGLESLKVQAIAARSYAIRCLDSMGYSALGAHVDDSTASQMYNNSQEYPLVLKAVDDTKGLVPTYFENIIDARFFSTSWGYTANFHETWSIEDRFPSDEISYLIAKPQFPGNLTSLHNEENFRAYITQQNDKAYDRFSPFFRWSITMSKPQIEEIIKENLPNLQSSQPEFVLTRNEDKNYIQKEVPKETGKLLNIIPIQRGEGGNLMEIEISTTSGIYRVRKELNIRQVLKPVNLISEADPIIIKRHDGSTTPDFPILPSSFFYIDTIRDNKGDISFVEFVGGGYGHGVGMSQYGVYGLSLLGKSYNEIIEHFYPGSEIRSLYTPMP